MSNTPLQPGIRVPQAALTFIVLIFALGALLLVSTNIDPKANIRGGFTATPSPTPIPVDPFANVQYVAWTSPDSLIQLEYPTSWTMQPSTQSGPFGYTIAPSGSQQTGIVLFLLPVKSQHIAGLAANASPQDLLKAAFASAPQPPTIEAVQTGALKGAGVHRTASTPDPAGGPAVNTDSEIWVLSLDAQNIAVIQATSPSNDWPKMQPVFQHVTNSLKIDVPNALTAMSKQFAATPSATGAATAVPATAATPAVTPAATTASTPAATLPATSAATAIPTVGATSAATSAATTAATSAAMSVATIIAAIAAASAAKIKVVSITPTASKTPSNTLTPSKSATNTPTPSVTLTPSKTATNTPTSSFTPSPTNTLTPSKTATNSPTSSFTPSPTNTAFQVVAAVHKHTGRRGTQKHRLGGRL